MLQPTTVTPHLLRQMFAGALDLSALPAALAGQLRSIAARIQRQAARAAKREHHAVNHRMSARKGGGEQERLRRLCAIRSGRLTVANGLVA